MALAGGGWRQKKKKYQCSKSQIQERITSSISSTNSIQLEEYNITAPCSSRPVRLSTVSGAGYHDVFPAKMVQRRREVCMSDN